MLERYDYPDKRVQEVWVGLYTAPAKAGRIGIERHCTRRQYEDELRRARAAKPLPAAGRRVSRAR